MRICTVAAGLGFMGPHSRKWYTLWMATVWPAVRREFCLSTVLSSDMPGIEAVLKMKKRDTGWEQALQMTVP